MQMDRVPMLMTPVPAGHAAQARVAPLPEARGWAASHSAQHTGHEVGICMHGDVTIREANMFAVLRVTICSQIYPRTSCRDDTS